MKTLDLVEWWAQQDLNLRPTSKVFGAALSAGLDTTPFQEQEGETGILLTFHFAFHGASFRQRVQFQGCRQFQWLAKAASGISVDLPVSFESPVQIAHHAGISPFDKSSGEQIITSSVMFLVRTADCGTLKFQLCY